jgi:deazaflavin-dependent oxidoreductase (nitroreductase family)
MPLPLWLARFNRRVTNRLMRPVARRLPGFGLLVHLGRASGRTYETPIDCWLEGGVITVALTYGPRVDWLRNLAAAGGGRLVMRGRIVTVGPPQALDEATGPRRVPPVVRVVVALIDVHDFVEFEVLTTPRPSGWRPPGPWCGPRRAA